MLNRKDPVLSQFQYDMIEGLMLSDAYISGVSSKAACLTLGQKENKIEFVEHVKNSLMLDSRISHLVPKDHWKSKATAEARYCTKAYSVFLKYRKRWYPKNKKIVPKDLILSPTVLLYWFIGDGNLKERTVRFSTCSFSEQDCKWLVSELSKLSLLSYVSNRNEIYLRRQSCDLFFEIIGASPSKCYKYKWNFKSIGDYKYIIISEELKIKIINLYKNANETSGTLSDRFGYSTVAISRMLKLNIPKNEYENLKKSKHCLRGKQKTQIQ